MPYRDRLQFAKEGFTTLEVLLSILMFTTAIATAVELFVGFTGRIVVLLKAERAAHGAQHVITAFSSAMSRAKRYALYPNRAAYLQYPALSGTCGDFVVLSMDDDSLLAFELERANLRIVENPDTPTAKERLWATGIEAPNGLCAIQHSACVLRFNAQTGATRTSFQTCGRAAAIR